MNKNKNLIHLWNNDEKRRTFLKAYKDWGIWLATPELDLTYYRYQLADGTNIIAMEHKYRGYVSYEEGYKWDIGVRYYVQKADEPFSPNSNSSISAVAELLKAAKLKQQQK